jgi:hypothetical protein
MNNSRFQGMNLSGSDTTSITVGEAAKLNMEGEGILNPATDGSLTIGGNINNRSAFTSINLNNVTGATAPDLSLLAHAVLDPGTLSVNDLITSFYYDPTTGTFTYQNLSRPGENLSTILDLLQNLKVQVYVNGVAQWQDSAQTIPLTTTISVIDSATAQAMIAEYNALGPVPAGSGNTGYAIGGGGKFVLTAANMDLGTSKGINSMGGGLYSVNNGSIYPLHNLFNTGAAIDVNLTGDLDMFSTSIASWDGGDININVGGNVNVGSSQFTPNILVARGIYSADRGDITVIAGGDINVNGSRIAGYDGGNVTVESLNGNIDTGSGAASINIINYFADVGGQYGAHIAEIPGSGILATTFYNDPGAVVGNILVEAPNGDVTVGLGGIVQSPFNGVDSLNSFVDILAGDVLLDSFGHPVTAANIAEGTAVQVSAGRNINAGNAGVIGQNIVALGTGVTSGRFYSRHSITIVSPNISQLIAFGQNVDVAGNVGPSVTLIGTESVSTTGEGTANILSSDANGGGSSFSQGTAANAAASGASASSDSNLESVKKSDSGTDDEAARKKPIALAQKVSRVTVLLPKKN